MIVLFHAVLHAALGTSWAQLASSRTPVAHARHTSWALGAIAASLAWTAPLAAYQVRLWPAYSLRYGYDPLLVPELYASLTWATPMAMIAYAGATAAGFFAVTAAGRAGRNLLSSLLTWAGWPLAGLLVALDHEHMLCITDFNSFWNGRGTSAFTHLHVLALGAGYAAMGIGLAAGRLLRVPGRSVPIRSRA